MMGSHLDLSLKLSSHNQKILNCQTIKSLLYYFQPSWNSTSWGIRIKNAKIKILFLIKYLLKF